MINRNYEKYGIDQLRYYLVKEVSLGNDGSISLENLKNCINNDLANNYGNLCQRVFSFIKKNCNNRIPFSSKLNDSDKRFLDNLKNFLPKLISLMDNQNLNEYIKSVVNFFLLKQTNTLTTRSHGLLKKMIQKE